MNPIVQSGMHPDADSLTAFAEQSLPEAEREQVLAHMATCSRCREVVFLAQQSVEEPSLAQVSEAIPVKSRRSWFMGWQWAWVPVAALAGFIGIAVVQHFRHVEPETRMTAKLSPTDALQSAEPAKAPVPSPPATVPRSTANPPAEPKPAHAESREKVQPRMENADAKQLDLKKSTERKDESAGAVGSLAAGSAIEASGASVASVHGTIAAKAKSAPYGGPSAVNQFQQQNQLQDNTAQENGLRQSQNAQVNVANKPDFASPPPATAAQSVTVQAGSKDLAPASPALASSQTPSIALKGQNTAALTALDAKRDADRNAEADKVQKMTLPSGLGVLSSASQSGKDIALDTAGKLFLSEDAGKHWQSIQAQWRGRAVLVRARPVGEQNGALRAPQVVRFELVNDKLQTWFSYEGKTWTPQPTPLK